MIGQQILNYKITKIIGKGGMATVYEAIHIKLDTKVAIKILDPILATNETIYKRFVQEAKIMASLNHENITKVIDFDDQDKLAILMEILDGQTLNDYIKQKGALNKEEIITIFTKILEGFSYAHKKGIVHRDVKPSNIFITNNGEVKIMDFGIAKITEEGATILTQTGTQMGTPVYMSPEQVQDAKHIDFKTDIYSLGVTLWYMLTGKPIYDTTKHATFAIYTKIVNEKLPILDDFSLLSKVIQKATEKEVDKRFKNCDAFNESISVKEVVKSKKTILNEEEKTIIKKPIIKTQKFNAGIKIIDFLEFIGLKYGDTKDVMLDLLGKPSSLNGYKPYWHFIYPLPLEYHYYDNNDMTVSGIAIYTDKKSKKITHISIRSKYRDILKTNNFKTEIIGQSKSQIIQLFSNFKNDSHLSNISFYNKQVNLNFVCSQNNDFNCSEISIYWKY